MLQAQKVAISSPVSKQKRTRGLGKKSKSQGLFQSDDQMSPGFASKTLPGSAKGVSSSSGEAEKSKGTRTGPILSPGQQHLDDSFAKVGGSDVYSNHKQLKHTLPFSRVHGGMAASAQLGSLSADDTNSCNLPIGISTLI